MSSKPIIVKYPLDLTGNNPNNLVLGEPHELPDGTNRAIVPNYGAFYAESLAVKDADSGEYLQPREQFKAVQLYQEATEVTGLEVTAVVVVTDPLVSKNIEIDYQAVGGEFSHSVTALRNMLSDLDLDERPIKWGDIIGKPDAFPPAPHLHDAGDLYGFEYVVSALEQVYHGIIIGDEASHDEIRQYIHLVEQAIRALVQALDDALQAHKADDTNPHRVTKAQTGLGLVQNYRIATKAEAEDGTHHQSYMTPLRTNEAIVSLAHSYTDKHENRKDNPHQVTKAQVGLGSVANYSPSSQAEAEAGSANNRYMTPLRTAQAIERQISIAFRAHRSDTSNPHSVTKAQVGLGSVSNYSIATQSQAEAGSTNSSYMTPLRTAQAIEHQISIAFRSHRSNTSNPHNVTKSQVGLGSVSNYSIATQSQAEAGTANTRYMTPLRTRQAILAHSQGGDHDNRYVRVNYATNGSIRVWGGKLQGYVNGAWRQIWPPVWS